MLNKFLVNGGLVWPIFSAALYQKVNNVVLGAGKQIPSASDTVRPAVSTCFKSLC